MSGRAEIGYQIVTELSSEGAQCRIRELEARVAHQQALAAQLTRHGFKGAAAEVLALVVALQARLVRERDAMAIRGKPVWPPG